MDEIEEQDNPQSESPLSESSSPAREHISQRVRRATVWSSFAEIMAKLIAPVVNMVLARLLIPAAFGAVATITMVLSFAEIFADAGFQKYLIQHEFSSKEALDRSTNVAFWTNMGVSVVLCALIFFFRHPLAILVGSPELGDSISIASLSIFIVAFSSIQMARFKRSLDFKTLFFARIGTALIPLLVTVPLAIALKNYWALLIGTISGHLLNAVILTIKSEWRPKFYYKFTVLKEMLSFSAWTLFESIAIWLTSYIDIFVVGNALNEYYLGIYKTSMSTVNSYMSIITAGALPVLFAALSRYQNDDKAFHKTFYSFQRGTALLILPMGVGIFLFRELVTAILLGEQWTEAAGFIGIWGVMSAITIVFSFYSSEVYRSKGKPKISLLSQLVHLGFLIPAIIISVGYGFEALYITRSLIRIQGIIFGCIIMQFFFGFRFVDMLKNLFPIAVATVVMGGVGYALRLVPFGIWWDFVAIAICIVVYFVCVSLFPSIRREIVVPFLKKIPVIKRCVR